MRIIITEEQKNNLFKPRNLGSRYDVWNRQQPEVIVDGWKTRIKLNQYDENGKRVGIWCGNPATFGVDYTETKPFLTNLFNKLSLRKDGVNDEIFIDGEDWVFNYKPGDDIIYINKYKV
jgi:hypothetical protein